MISLTHVCQAWREIFISHASLWTRFDCVDMDKTRVYLERSKSSPISLWIGQGNDLSPHDPLLQVIPHATSRLKSLTVHAKREQIDNITLHLSHPAPRIEHLSIYCGSVLDSANKPVLETALFNGDLSSLHALYLMHVCTKLPWRNMVNLTSFTLGHTSPGKVSIRQLLDFLDSAPRLERVKLDSATPTSGAQGGRLVSLERLKSMTILGNEPCSLLLDHLLIPVGAKLSVLASSFHGGFEDQFPRSLDNLRNLSDFTNIHLDFADRPDLRFTGPNGQVTLTRASPGFDSTSQAFEFLAQIDTSKVERLDINRGNPPSGGPPYRALLRMETLRTLKLSRCQGPHLFIRALRPGTSSSRAVVCPNLEDLILVLRTNSETFKIRDLVRMATARALSGAKLRTVKIIGGQGEPDPGGALELGKHVSHVEYVPVTGVVHDDSDGLVDDSDEDSDDSDDSDDSSYEGSSGESSEDSGDSGESDWGW